MTRLRVALSLIALRLVVPIMRRTFRLQRVVTLLADSTEVDRREPATEEYAARVARRLWRNSAGPCLERSLALFRVLGQVGASPVLVCAVTTAPDGYTGHAWVEVGNEAVLEPADPRARYAVLLEFASDGAVMSSRSSVR